VPVSGVSLLSFSIKIGMNKRRSLIALAIWGALAGTFIATILLALTTLVSLGTIPMIIQQTFDPWCGGHSLMIIISIGAIIGALAGGYSASRSVDR
jgi:hypothetical protein